MNDRSGSIIFSIAAAIALVLFVLSVVAVYGSSKPAPVRTDVLHVYLTDSGRLVYLCTTDKPVQPQVLNCDGGTVLLTAQLYERVVLSTFLIGEGK